MKLSADTRERIEGMMGLGFLSELQRRVYLALEARSLGRGGAAAAAEAAGVSENTVRAGLRDLEDPDVVAQRLGEGRSRRAGGGRRTATEEHPGLEQLVPGLVDDPAYGDPGRDVAYCAKSVRNVAEEASAITGAEAGGDAGAGHETVRAILVGAGYSKKGNKKCLQVGTPHPDRDAQFGHIASRIEFYLSLGLPVLSIDTKKKELLGDFVASGTEWTAPGTYVCVKDHDFADPRLGKAVPHGACDVGRNEGFVTVGNSADTAQFAMSSVQAWLDEVGRHGYPGLDRLLVLCDGGGSNSWRSRLWRLEPRLFADRNGIQVEVCHHAPGNSKSDKIERRLFSQISQISIQWRGQPPASLEVVRNLIASTTTKTGLVVRARIDRTVYERGIRVPQEVMDSLEIVRNDFHGEWNYLVRVRRTLDLGAAMPPGAVAA